MNLCVMQYKRETERESQLYVDSNFILVLWAFFLHCYIQPQEGAPRLKTGLQYLFVLWFAIKPTFFLSKKVK